MRDQTDYERYKIFITVKCPLFKRENKFNTNSEMDGINKTLDDTKANIWKFIRVIWWKILNSHFRFLLLLEIDLGSKIRQFHSVDRHWKHVKNFMFYNTRNKQFHDQFFTYEHTKPHFFQSFSFFAHVRLFFMLHF